ncbi:hypothetical protein KXS11_07730 [Plantibacter flavus]|uniref:peptidoglycan-binding domain-containing protein n=1 Tax=Plantibacter flavus TaxID=150123 RepID=UPI003F178612
MADRDARRTLSWIWLIATMSAAVGAAVSVSVLTLPPPDLREPDDISSVPVGTDVYDDARSVQISVDTPTDVPLTAPISGRVTSFTCRVGATLSSGETALSIDGTPALALATEVPLWRDVLLDTTGDDVRALQTEFTRLGYPLETDGVAGRGTLAAARSLFAGIGLSIGADRVPSDAIVFLPSAIATIEHCDVPIGSEVQRGESLATFKAPSAVTSPVQLPSDLTPGAREIVLGSVRLPVGQDGSMVVPEDVVEEMHTDTPGEVTGPRRVDAQLVLTEPIPVSVVPPSALFSVDGTTGCVVSDGRGFAVDILGSRLGETIVLFHSEAPPAQVEVQPKSDSTCR